MFCFTLPESPHNWGRYVLPTLVCHAGVGNRDEETQSKLRKYLRERGISRKLISGVWHFLDQKDL
eukprot:4629898-Amphidinium_carterae.1